MEMYVKIIDVRNLASRDYFDKDGQPQIFKSKGFVLSNGNNVLYCEAAGKYAESLELRTFDKSQFYVADINISVGHYFDSKGNERLSNEIALKRLNIV